MQPTVIDLFSGCGGMSWGLHKRGFKILAGIDHLKIALDTFKFNHKEAVIFNRDITHLSPFEVREHLNLSIGELDCLVGGPPCQGFSKNVPASYRFLEDSRNQLFMYYLNFVKELLPKVVIMENVAEIYNAYDGEVRTEIVSTLQKLGYEVEVKVVFAPDYGVPQRRRRCFFFASRTGIAPSFPSASFGDNEVSTLFGDISKYRSAWSAISDLPVLLDGEGYEPMEYDKEPENDFQIEMRKDSQCIFDHITRKLKPTQLARVNSIGPGQGLKELPEAIRPKSGYSGAYGRLDYISPASTITRWVFHPGSGRYFHPREDRLITMREAARIQTFSDDFKFCGTFVQKAGQIGNAVPPLLMYTFAPKILACLARN